MHSRRQIAQAALEECGSVRKAAASLGVAKSTFQDWLKSEAKEDEKPKFTGSVKAREVIELPLPEEGKVKTYIFTCAQNNTDLLDVCWQNVLALASHYDAEIIAGSITYATNGRASNSQKRGAKTSRETLVATEVWDDRITPHLRDYAIQIAPDLIWCGELNIIPTANDPISGLESYTGRFSCIIPHTKFAVTSIPSPKGQATKTVYTTGAVTKRNYIEKKAGQKASFHHGYGGLIVEVRHDGSWYARQLNADSDGVIYDLDCCADGGKVTVGHRIEALVWGDIHTRKLEPNIRKLGWGNGGILDALRPKVQVFHDLLDFRSQNHHDRKNQFRVYKKYVTGATSVENEVREVAEFLGFASRGWCESVIVASNHDEALVRWLQEADYRCDPENALFLLEATAASYRAIRNNDNDFYPVRWAVTREDDAGRIKNARWLRRDESYVVCPDRHGGIELSMHGDKGPNGSHGNIRVFARTGRKCIIAHGHGAHLFEGAMQVPLMGALDQDYNEGMSSWSHGFGVVYPNGKRSLITIRNNRYKGRD
jgi:hypothetical protein